MKYLFLGVILIQVIPNYIFSGFDSWQRDGINGGVFIYESRSDFSLVIDSFEVKNLKKFYFKNNATVGVFLKSNVENYFISIPEKSELLFFEDKTEWSEKVLVEGLKPIIWTRWYNGRWGFLERTTEEIMFNPIKLIIVLIISCLLLMYLIINISNSILYLKRIKQDKSVLKSFYYTAFYLILFVVLATICFPQSV